MMQNLYTSLLLGLLLLVLPSAHATYSSKRIIGDTVRIHDHIRIPRFTIPPAKNGSLVFPSDASLPPFLRGLVLTSVTRARITAISPSLPSAGRVSLRHGPLRRKRTFFVTLIVNFRAPRLRLILRGRGSLNNGFILRGFATHIFRRPFGMRLERSRLSVSAGTTALTDRLEANPAGPRLVAIVDHARAAQSVDLSLADSVVVVFGSPAIGSQLWRLNSAVGLELPVEVMIAASPLGKVYVGWNSAALLRSRFRLRMVDDVLERLDSALAALASAAAGLDAEDAFAAAGLRFDRLRSGGRLDGVAMTSQRGSPARAFAGLTSALEAAPPVNIAYQVPHDLAAEAAGLPTDGKFVRVAVFGNPALGTQIMQGSFTAALDLPVKMAVWTDSESDPSFTVGYTTPAWIGRRHNVDVPEMLEGALANFANVAVQAGA